MSDTETEIRRVWNEKGFTCMVTESTSPYIGSWYCAYIGVPEDSIAGGVSPDDLPVKVHGGLTYGPRSKHFEIDENGEKPLTWYGWDYNHAIDDKVNKSLTEVMRECSDAVNQFKSLTAKDIVEHKLRFMPDKITDKVQIRQWYDGEPPNGVEVKDEYKGLTATELIEKVREENRVEGQ